MPYLDKLSGFVPQEYQASRDHVSEIQKLGISNAELARAWDTTKTFCMLVNYAADSKRKIPQETLLNTMASVMYRLLNLSFDAGSLDEMVRLGLLAFCSKVFLQWSRVRSPPRHLSRSFRDCLLSLTEPVSPQVTLWLLLTGYISVFSDEDEAWLQPWLRAVLEMCGVAC